MPAILIKNHTEVGSFIIKLDVQLKRMQGKNIKS